MALKDKIILIIDDDQEIIKLVTKIFAVLGTVVLSAENLSEAKKVLYNSIPHLIFLDINLGSENGLEYITFLKFLHLGKSLPIIIFSSVDDPKILKEAIKLGAVDTIEKPIVASILIQKARKYIKEASSNLIVFNDYLNNPQTFKMDGELAHLNSQYLNIEARIKIAKDSKVKLKSSFLDMLGVSKDQFTCTDNSVSIDLGKFLNKLYFSENDNAVIQKINKLRSK